MKQIQEEKHSLNNLVAIWEWCEQKLTIPFMFFEQNTKNPHKFAKE